MCDDEKTPYVCTQCGAMSFNLQEIQQCRHPKTWKNIGVITDDEEIPAYVCYCCGKMSNDPNDVKTCRHQIPKDFTDEELAKIFYILVHDFDTQLVFEAESQNRNGNHEYIDSIKLIKDWASERRLSTIQRHAEDVLNRIEMLSSSEKE